jgi:HEAT repeat protein
VPERVFLPGARHAQWEAVWGGRVDTAGALRAACGAGLVAWQHPDALVVLADHLADPLPEVRASAARSVGQRDREDGVPLLRLCFRLGDEEPRVIGECARALLALAPSASLPLVVALLAAPDDALFGEAALALGESRLPGACDALCAAWRDTFERERRRVLLAALGALRREEAFAFLLQRVEEESSDVAADAVETLAAYAGEEGLRARVAAAVARADDEALTRCFQASSCVRPESGGGGHPPGGAE